ncbi:MAG: transglycosylase SLT domain-containing protein [Deltaproteobacteria bacterium]|nr:transglycosylase SLT domain-containing protein [Deltaproteobacteria bacterium]
MPFKIKNPNENLTSVFAIVFSILLVISINLALPFSVFADLSLLTKHITAYNLEQHKKNLSDGSYKGEEGVLRIDPEVGEVLGLKVFISRDFLKATELYREADALIEEATEALITQEKERFSGEHVKKVGELAVRHNKVITLAWEYMMAYRSDLTAEEDVRLNVETCSRLMEKLLQEDIEKTSYNLRDALGNFYNRCQNLPDGTSLNTENIEFVNYVFYEFTKDASEETANRFDLDRCSNKDAENSWPVWKYALGSSSSRFAPVLEDVFEKHQKTRYPVDILLFLALIRQESNYDARNVSYVGAAGLTQIMPSTAKGLGMQNIFSPPYFKEAGALLGRERRLKRKATTLLLRVTEENCLELAKQARDLMQESLDIRRKREKLYRRYRRELLNAGTDERLNPRKALEYGLEYFSQMMKIQKGDISLALASYNAGPHRVKQYNGIPPFEETVSFRNKVLKYYRVYKSRVRKYFAKLGYN